MREPVSAKDAGEPPLCECHGERMLWHKKGDRKAGGQWLCRVKECERQQARYWRSSELRSKRREQMRERYWSLSGMEIAAERLRLRRHSGLKRMAARHAKRQEEM